MFQTQKKEKNRINTAETRNSKSCSITRPSHHNSNDDQCTCTHNHNFHSVFVLWKSAYASMCDIQIDSNSSWNAQVSTSIDRFSMNAQIMWHNTELTEIRTPSIIVIAPNLALTEKRIQFRKWIFVNYNFYLDADLLLTFTEETRLMQMKHKNGFSYAWHATVAIGLLKKIEKLDSWMQISITGTSTNAMPHQHWQSHHTLDWW